jgi:hypothetical protein
VGQQGFGIELRVDDEQGAGCARGSFDVGSRVEVMIEGVVGGFVEFFWVEGIVRGNVVSFRQRRVAATCINYARTTVEKLTSARALLLQSELHV